MTRTDSPIFVTGMPRSGTTFVQHLLSQHPDIRIHGQEPAQLCWGDWLKTSVAGVGAAQQSNQELQYDVPHYAAPANRFEAASRLLDYVRWYLTGGDKTRRWGAKSLTQCRVAPDIISEVWPETRWVVCIRDPFRSIESLRNTFDAEAHVSLEIASQWWTAAARFAFDEPAALPVQFDRLNDHSSRVSFLEELFEFIDEEPNNAVRDYVAQWPIIHKVTPDARRQYRLSADERARLLESQPEFATWVERLGYGTREVVAS